jgi:hypothetical protein
MTCNKFPFMCHEASALVTAVIAEQTAELVEPVKASTIAEQALKESVTAQTVTTGGASTETSKAALEVTAGTATYMFANV